MRPDNTLSLDHGTKSLVGRVVALCDHFPAAKHPRLPSLGNQIIQCFDRGLDASSVDDCTAEVVRERALGALGREPVRGAGALQALRSD